MQVSKEGIERVKAANELSAVIAERGIELRKKGRVLVGFRETNGKFVADLARCPVVLPEIGERLGIIA